MSEETLSPEDFDGWMKDHGYSVRGLASTLGIVPSTITRWLNGSRPIPGWLPFALRGISCIDRH